MHPVDLTRSEVYLNIASPANNWLLMLPSLLPKLIHFKQIVPFCLKHKIGIVNKCSPRNRLYRVGTLALPTEVVYIDQKVVTEGCKKGSVVKYFHDFNSLRRVVRIGGAD